MASKGGRVPESHEPGEQHFHYNREEREALLSDETKRILTKSKFFTMNRRNMIILADIVVILLFTMIFTPIVLGGKSSVRIDGFRTFLRAYEYDGSILISLKIEAPENNPQEAGLVSAVFTVDGRDETDEELDLLPAEVNNPRVLRAEFKASESSDPVKVYAEVVINDMKRNLSAKVKKE